MGDIGGISDKRLQQILNDGRIDRYETRDIKSFLNAFRRKIEGKKYNNLSEMMEDLKKLEEIKKAVDNFFTGMWGFQSADPASRQIIQNQTVSLMEIIGSKASDLINSASYSSPDQVDADISRLEDLASLLANNGCWAASKALQDKADKLYYLKLDLMCNTNVIDQSVLDDFTSSIKGGDLQVLVMALGFERADLLEQQIADQMKIMKERNEKLKKLSDTLAALRKESGKIDKDDKKKQGEIDSKIEKIKGEMDALNSEAQMDMIRLQGLMSKRDNIYQMVTNIMKTDQRSKDAVVGNLR